MTAVKNFERGKPITAARLNEIVEIANRLDADSLPRQDNKASEGPLITDDEKVEEAQATIEVWSEVYRETVTVRVENPDDSSQYVDVDRINAVTFRRPDGVLVLLRMDNS